MSVVESHLEPESLVARILAELRANPDARTLLLRALFTDEFLGIPACLDRVEADIAELKVDVAQLKVDVAQLKGDSLEIKLGRRIRPRLSQEFGLRRSETMQGPLRDPARELRDAVESACDAGVIDDAQESRIDETDLIIRARRKSDRRPVWVVVEASNHLGQRDIERARDTAQALRAVFEEEVLAVIAGYRIHDRDRERAAQADVHVVLVSETC